MCAHESTHILFIIGNSTSLACKCSSQCSHLLKIEPNSARDRPAYRVESEMYYITVKIKRKLEGVCNLLRCHNKKLFFQDYQTL